MEVHTQAPGADVTQPPQGTAYDFERDIAAWDRPYTETERLHALHGLGILDTEAEAHFDRLARMARALFHTQTALISLVDANRQWFKSRVGLSATETPRAVSFCSHAIASDCAMVVEDAAADARFADNPLVVGAPFIRFYAGAPLRLSNGFRIGTLCVLDPSPRRFSREECIQLERLAKLVVQEIERRASRARIARETLVRASYERALERRSEELVEARAIAAISQRAKTEFLSNMSHEFRTPLNAILGFSELLLHGAVGKLTGQQEEYLRVVEASGRHLLSLLGQVLQMSRLHAGKAQVAVDACAPLSVLDVAMPRLAALAARAGVRFESKVDDAIPAFMGDAAVTAQALTLIIENAVRFSPKKGLVTVEAEARGSEVRFIVSDEGCGIPETEREMVFEPFYQVGRTHTRQTGGTGLGLTIARRLMDAQSGSIRLESREPRGTRVVLSLPRAPEAEYEPVSALGH